MFVINFLYYKLCIFFVDFFVYFRKDHFISFHFIYGFGKLIEYTGSYIHCIFVDNCNFDEITGKRVIFLLTY